MKIIEICIDGISIGNKNKMGYFYVIYFHRDTYEEFSQDTFLCLVSMTYNSSAIVLPSLCRACQSQVELVADYILAYLSAVL